MALPSTTRTGFDNRCPKLRFYCLAAICLSISDTRLSSRDAALGSLLYWAERASILNTHTSGALSLHFRFAASCCRNHNDSSEKANRSGKPEHCRASICQAAFFTISNPFACNSSMMPWARWVHSSFDPMRASPIRANFTAKEPGSIPAFGRRGNVYRRNAQGWSAGIRPPSCFECLSRQHRMYFDGGCTSVVFT